jgi:hypothetical protein
VRIPALSSPFRGVECWLRGSERGRSHSVGRAASLVNPMASTSVSLADGCHSRKVGTRSSYPSSSSGLRWMLDRTSNQSLTRRLIQTSDELASIVNEFPFGEGIWMGSRFCYSPKREEF